jgi:DNA-binding transcriptional MerR regulator
MKHHLFAVKDFAKLVKTTTRTLRWYDGLEVLSPAERGENNYRYYSKGQITLINIIRTLRNLGMSLPLIKKMKDQRTPEMANELFGHQVERINVQIEELMKAQELITTFQEIIRSVDHIDESKITIQSLPAVPIVLGSKNDYSHDRDDYDALHDFFTEKNAVCQDLDLGYPVWGIFSPERIRQGQWRYPDRYYFFNPSGADQRPAALYAVGYARGSYGQTDELYRRMIKYINRNGYEIAGDTYEEYPLNEVCIADENNYLIRVLITVQRSKFESTFSRNTNIKI